ncbi:conserved hypothetical protein [Sphingomonas aurantiaca]|uniref:Chitinase class I n=1 Tax=Sphingomonas aurantiaca TaxID=185949 RepID=A0A5E7YRR8_9SPHN|nr:hypothetical protein [Sphingomonas aurantiaca]VVT08922.1 conserved hypothetical protein [Sphingomonas aurantiaca]
MTTASKRAPAPAHSTHGLASPGKFFASIRPLFGTMAQAQVEGIQAKLAAFAAQASPLAYVAYGLATSFHETGAKMQPVPEIGRGRSKAYGKPGEHAGQIAYGRGDVQLTWDYNYERADAELGLKGKLTSNYDRALETEISAQIMVLGMTEGWFTSRKFSTYLPAKGPATLVQFTSARRIINGIDRAEKVAGYAMSFQAALIAGGWA